MEDIDFRRPRGLDRSVVLGLASAQWVAAHQNLLIVGPTGAGKTFLASALSQAAVRAGHTSLYLRAPRMLDDLAIAHGDGRWARLMATWARSTCSSSMTSRFDRWPPSKPPICWR